MNDRTQSFKAGDNAAVILGEIGICSSHMGVAR